MCSSIPCSVPGLYPGRTRHIHVKLQAPNRPVITTQLYFRGEARNERDFLFDARLLIASAAAGNGQAARFDFVVDLGDSVDAEVLDPILLVGRLRNDAALTSVGG
jgi:protocatechuate 3,4-dioxygenase beta subunit